MKVTLLCCDFVTAKQISRFIRSQLSADTWEMVKRKAHLHVGQFIAH